MIYLLPVKLLNEMSNSKRGYFKVAMFEKQRLEAEQDRVIKMTMNDVTWFLNGQQGDNKAFILL